MGAIIEPVVSHLRSWEIAVPFWSAAEWQLIQSANLARLFDRGAGIVTFPRLNGCSDTRGSGRVLYPVNEDPLSL